MGRLVIGQDMGVVVCCGDDGFSAAPKDAGAAGVAGRGRELDE